MVTALLAYAARLTNVNFSHMYSEMVSWMTNWFIMTFFTWNFRTLPPFLQRITSQLSFRYLKARNLKSKSASFLGHINVHSPDIVAITKIWFKPRDAVACSECTSPGYKLLDQARPSLRQDGAALVFMIVLTTKVIPLGKENLSNYLIELSTGSIYASASSSSIDIHTLRNIH